MPKTDQGKFKERNFRTGSNINNTIAKGTLVFNYLGHGGGSGMAHERVVTRPMILGWRNYDKLTFFVTPCIVKSPINK